MSPKTRVEVEVKRPVTNAEFSAAARYVETMLGLYVTENCPDALIRAVAKKIQEK